MTAEAAPSRTTVFCTCRCIALLAPVTLALAGCVRLGYEDRGGEMAPRDAAVVDRPHRDADTLDLAGVDAAVPPDGPGGCTCPLGCTPDGGACRRLVPSNVGHLKFKTCAALALSGIVTVDTGACKVLTCQGTVVTIATNKALCVISTQSLTSDGITTIVGPRPLVLLVEGDVTITGTLLANAKGSTPGPGGGAGGVATASNKPVAGAGFGGGKHCVCTNEGVDDCGGGGGGFGTQGAAGGKEGNGCAVSASGGVAFGAPTLEPLVGGSGGSSGGNITLKLNLLPGAGGGGGGALQISAQGTITLSGTLNAGGGGGGSGSCPSSYCSGGGGGSGGAILFEAAVIQGGGPLSVNGGGGGGGATSAVGQPGKDAYAGPTPAPGGAGNGTGAGSGGAGAAGSATAKPGGSGPTFSGVGGGGGGGLGRVRLNYHPPAGPAPKMNVSGQLTTGSVKVE